MDRRNRTTKDLYSSAIIWIEIQNEWHEEYNPWMPGHGYLETEIQAPILADDFESYECYYN